MKDLGEKKTHLLMSTMGQLDLTTYETEKSPFYDASLRHLVIYALDSLLLFFSVPAAVIFLRSTPFSFVSAWAFKE